MHILIVEDDRRVRQLIRDMMQSLCDEISECADGLEAVQYCTTSPPDLVLMDISMPRMDGLEATRRIHAQNPDIRVLIVTQYDDPAYQQSAAAAGASGYFLKDDLIALEAYLKMLHRTTPRN